LTEPLQVGQFAIVDHEPVDRGPNAGVFHGKGPTDDRAELFIAAEGTTPAGEAFAGHVVSALGNVFNTLDMSLTGSLQRLFEEAERNLLDWNRKSIVQHRVSIGLSAFGRRGSQAVIAQAGPSAVFHLHQGKVDTYFTDEEHGRPIGAGPVNPQLTRISFDPGDRVLLISTAALGELDDEVISGILALPNQQVLQDLYHRMQHLRHLTAVLVTGTPAAPELPEGDGEFVIDATNLLMAPAPREAATGSPATTFQPVLFIDDEAEDAVASARKLLLDVTPRAQMASVAPHMVLEMPAPLLRASGESPLVRIAAERQARAAMAQAAVAGTVFAAGGRPNWRAHGSAKPALDSMGGAGQSLRRRHDRRDSFSRGLVHEELPPRPTPLAESMPLVDELAAEYRARGATLTPSTQTIAGEASATLGNGGSLVRVRGNMGGRWKGGGSFSRRSATTGSMPPTWLVVLVGLGILLTLVGIITVPRLLSEQSGARYASLIDGAQQRLSTSLVQADPAERRKALTEAQAMLLEAKDANPNDSEAARLLTDVTSAITAMDGVKAPAQVDVIGSLEQFGDKPVSVSRLTVGEDTAYILDNASSQVIAMTLASGERKVVFGEDKDQKHGRPVATAYLEGSDFGGAAVLIADLGRSLWAYSTASGLRPVPFAAPSGLTITDIATNGRDLYVLDAGQAVVYRFTQGDGGYGAAPTKWLESSDLAAARRLMVDGETVTADANGHLHRFWGQLALELSQGGIDKRLIAPEAAQTLNKNGDLAFLDAPNDRVVFFRRDGTFDRQYRHKDFRASSAFVIRNGTGYLFSEGKLRKVTF
jgi:hypothetical protein